MLYKSSCVSKVKYSRQNNAKVTVFAKIYFLFQSENFRIVFLDFLYGMLKSSDGG